MGSLVGEIKIMEKIIGRRLDSMEDKRIESLLKGKEVELNFTKRGVVKGFFNCSHSDIPEQKICGIILEDGSEIVFTDDLEIRIIG